MNKIKFFLFAILVSVFMIPNVFAKGVEIKSIELDSKSENTTINSEPTFNGLEMNFDVSFKQKNDFAKYKVIIKNDTGVDYKISDDTSFNDSKYITYKYEVGSELKAKSEVTVYVTMTYTKEVDASLMTESKYTETNKAIVQLKNEVDNPNTGVFNSTLLLMIVMIGAIIGLFILNKKYNMQNMTMILLVGILISPMLIHAIETIKLTMNVNVEIEKGYEVGYYISDAILIPESEKKNYESTDDTECVVIYLGENKYNYCENVILKDSKVYLEGEKVELKEVSVLGRRIIDMVRTPSKNSTQQMGVQDGEPNLAEREGLSFICELRDDGSYLCREEEFTTYTINRWYYSKRANILGYTQLETDRDVMNFAELDYDYWNNLDGEFSVYGPQSFTMPGHNVIFLEDSLIPVN